MFEVTIQHEGLNAYRVVKGYTPQEAQLKASLQMNKWNEQWERVTATRNREEQKQKAVMHKENAIAQASRQSEEAEVLIASMDTLLAQGVRRNYSLDWEALKANPKYPNLKFARSEPLCLRPLTIPPEPQFVRPNVNLTIVAKLIPSIRKQREHEAMTRAQKVFTEEYQKWEQDRRSIEVENEKRLARYSADFAEFNAAKKKFLSELDSQRKAIDADVLLQHSAIDERRASYLKKVPESVIDYCDLVLQNSEYPDSFPSNWHVDYVVESKILIVDYSLPDITALPKVKGYKYVATKNEIQPIPVSDSWLNKTYDSVLYQVTLRTLYSLFQADSADAIDAIVFNGMVKSIDKATGKEVEACVITIQAIKPEILELNMEQVVPKDCFKKLKGVSAAKLINLAPVRPILQLNKADNRFVVAHEVVDSLDESSNLAAMDWEDFEHLIREVFEKEFSGNGSEVKITQASRDGGVDAVAFDEDPIRGGKIIIQAKRYTNTVSVSAVRDLYGTILNEGANKGILVTTADYGPDAYEFAKGKPITLLSGNELLYLLQKHGHRARINLAEARLITAEQARTAAKS